MEKKKESICRLCLKMGRDSFSDYSDSYSKSKVKVVLPQLNMDNPSNFVICSECRTSVEESYRMKKIFSRNDEIIRAAKARQNVTGPINLNHVIKKPATRNMALVNQNICRICFNIKGSSFLYIDKKRTDQFVKDVVRSALINLDCKLTRSPAICVKCYKTLTAMYKFKIDCILVDRKLATYSKHNEEKQIDLYKVLEYLKKQKSNRELDGEKSTQGNSDINKKRPLPEDGDMVPSKKQKSSNSESNAENGETHAGDEEGETEGLPHYIFNQYLVYIPKDHSRLKDWLAQVDALKQKNYWSDLKTMNKVLEKLKEMGEVHTWFSDLSKSITWDEFKTKLGDMFPRPNDYSYLVKHIVTRKKKPTETCIEYYDGRMPILHALNITGEAAVSCLIGGLTDVLAACVARGGNYKTPEELRLHFKTCDARSPLDVKSRNRFEEMRNRRDARRQELRKKYIRCNMCEKFTHKTSDCPFLQESKSTEKPKTPETSRERVNSREKSSKRQSSTASTKSKQDGDVSKNKSQDKEKPSKGQSSTASTEGKQDGDVSKNNSQDREKPSKRQSSTASTEGKRDGDVSKNKSQHSSSGSDISSSAAHKHASTITSSKSEADKDAKRDLSEKKDTKKQDDSCFVKPLPPSRRGASSVTSVSKGSSSNRPHKTSTTRGTTKQNDASTKKEPSSTSQKPQTKGSKDTSSSKPQERGSKKGAVGGTKSTRGTSKGGNDSSRGKSSVAPPDRKGGSYSDRGISSTKRRSEQRGRAYSSRSMPASTSPTQVRGRYSDRDRSNVRSEESYAMRGTSADTPYGRRDEDYYLRGMTDRPQEPVERDYLERGLSDIDRASYYARLEEYQRGGGYSSRELMDARWEEPLSSSRPYEERDAGYDGRGTFRPDEQSLTSSSWNERWQEPMEQDVPSSRMYEERDLDYTGRGKPGIRPEEWREEIYSRADRSLEPVAQDVYSSRAYDERVVGYGRDTSNARGEEIYSRNEGWQEPVERDERDLDYGRRGTADVRPEEQSEETYRRSERWQEPMERDLPRSKVYEERDLDYGRRDTANIRPEEQSEEIFARGDRWQEPVERDVPRSIAYEERDLDYNRRGTADVRPEERSMEIYSRGDRWQEPVERDVSIGRAYDERDLDYNRRGISGVRPEERSKDTYRSEKWQEPLERDVLISRANEDRDLDNGRRGTSDVRLEERSERWQEPVKRDASSSRAYEERNVDHSRKVTSNVRPEEWRTEYVPSGKRSQELVERGASNIRTQEVRDVNYTERTRVHEMAESTSRDRRQEEEERKIMHANRDVLPSRPPVLNEGDIVTRNPSSARSQDGWESEYVDRSVTYRRDVRDTDKEAPSIRRPEQKELVGSGFRSAELMNRDAPSARLRDKDYPNRVAPIANPRNISSERLPGRSEGSYFNKSLTSSSLLGSSLGSLFSLSLASKGLISSYPSSATAAKPLGQTSGSLLNRGTLYSRMQDYNASHRGILKPSGLYSRRSEFDDKGHEPTAANYKRVQPGGGGHEEQSHRDMCMKCYTIGHKTVDCVQFIK